MSDVRTWVVRSNSFRPDYGINGRTLVDAVEKNFERIARDLRMGDAGGYRLLSVAAEFRPDILRGRGGVELTVSYSKLRGDGSPVVAAVWINAAPDDLPGRHEFKIRGKAA